MMPVDGEKQSREFYGLYHEKQIGALCAVHALNNLMQRRCFDEVELASIAHELDEKERVALGGERLDGEEASGNVRADGFFSSQVVLEAVRRAPGNLTCASVALDASSEGYVAAPQREKAFIFNRREHWFALRNVGGEWFDLNSMFAAPKHLEPGDMLDFFKHQQLSGYSIFVVRGGLPPAPLDGDRDGLKRAIHQCRFQSGDISQAAFATKKKTTDFAAFRGSGARLVEAPEKPQLDPSLLLAAQDDPELAAAIAASLDHQPPPRDAKQDADEIRRKRLARFGGGGGASGASGAKAEAEGKASQRPRI